MNISRALKTLVLAVGEELAVINERNRNAYYSQVASNRKLKASADAGEVESVDVVEPEPPMQVVMVDADAATQAITDQLTSLIKAAENFNEREEGIENMPGVKAYKLDPQNPNAGPAGVMSRSVMSGNVATPEIPAAEPVEGASTVTPVSNTVATKMAEEDAKTAAEGVQKTADRAAATRPAPGAPGATAVAEEPVSRRALRK